MGLPGSDVYYSAILAVFKMQPINHANDNPNINMYMKNGYNQLKLSVVTFVVTKIIWLMYHVMLMQYDFSFKLQNTFSNYTSSRFDGYQYV